MLIHLEPFLSLMPAWLLVLFRLAGIFAFTPLFSARTIPAVVKALLALGLSFCVFPLLLARGKTGSAVVGSILDSGLSLATVIPAVAAELLVGSVIGFCATLPLIGMQLGGRVVSQQMGLGLAEVFSPGEEQSGITSRFFYLLGLALFLILGGHRALLMMLVGSFDHVPLGGSIAGGESLDLMIGLLASSYELALHVAAPLLCLIFLETVAMGFITRTVPQLNILSIGFAVRIVLGAGTLIGAVGVASVVFIDVMEQTLGRLALFFGL